MIAIDAVKRTIVLVKKFGIYLCVPASLIIASNYTNSNYRQYRVTAKIAVSGIPVESAIADIKSKHLVRKTLEQLPFQASYYDANSPRDEVFGNALPVKLVFDHPRYNDDEVWLDLKLTGTNSFMLAHVDTVAYHEFNEPIREWYGTFKVVHRPGAQYRQASYTVRLDDPAKLYDQYYNNLRAETEGDDGATISIVSGNPQKGAYFLNKLLQLYGAGKHSASRHSYTKLSSENTAGRITILEKPENNIESAGISSFWIYSVALLIGLLIPVGRSAINRHGANIPWFKLVRAQNMSSPIAPRVTVKQLGIKVARYRRLLFREA
jgi:hypothetical protein